MRYSIRIGDLLADPGDGDMPAEKPGEGRRFRTSIEWPSGLYFESARGETVIRLMSAAETGSWQLRAELRLFVSPDKLGEERYEAMYESLSRLACGFVFDLVSKSMRHLDLEIGHGGIAPGSAQVRLRFLESVWRNVSVLLRSIQKEPLTALRRSRRHRPVWGVESLRPRTLTELASRGLSSEMKRVDEEKGSSTRSS